MVANQSPDGVTAGMVIRAAVADAIVDGITAWKHGDEDEMDEAIEKAVCAIKAIEQLQGQGVKGE